MHTTDRPTGRSRGLHAATAGRLPKGLLLNGAIALSMFYCARSIAHTSFRPSSGSPTRRVIAPSVGKTPTTSVRRLISLLSRFSGLVQRSLARCRAGNSCRRGCPCPASIMSMTIWESWPLVDWGRGAPLLRGHSRIIRCQVRGNASRDGAARYCRGRRAHLRMKRALQRCHEAVRILAAGPLMPS